MNPKPCMILSLAIAVLGATALTAGAQASPRKRFEHADRNDDGRVGPREAAAERKWEQQQKAKVNTPREEKADKNDNGVVDPKEAAKARTDAYLDHRSDVDRKWEAKADTDTDGKVSAAELRAFHLKTMDKNGDGRVDAKERHIFWMLKKAKVNTDLEKKYDADGDGWISGEEAREMLRDLLTLINTHGKAKVNTDIEKEYDLNADGVIDKDEAGPLKEALGI